jgi:hypothetical protein
MKYTINLDSFQAMMALTGLTGSKDATKNCTQNFFLSRLLSVNEGEQKV